MWMQTRSGKKFDFDRPETWSDTFDLHDIAYSLSNTCRYNGHSTRFYSVCEHVVRAAKAVLRLPDTDSRLWWRIEVAYETLHHDDEEYVLGDVIRPLKQKLPEYKKIAAEVEWRLALKYGIVPHSTYSDDVKKIDATMRWFERDAVMSPPPDDWGDEPPDPYSFLRSFDPKIPRWSVLPRWYWRREYLRLHYKLAKMREDMY